jgi:pimeloyl-ACP methyl ester carboxylesterase
VAADERVVLGGHDWGGAVVWRFALWRPEMVRGVFSVCTPFWLPSPVYLSKREVVERLPNFGYQAQFDGTEVDEGVVGREKIKAFLSVMFGARRADGQVVFDVAKGLRLDKLEPAAIGESPLLSREEMEFYADEYVRNGIRGPLCWYKTGRVNYEEERTLLEESKVRVTMPALMVVASRDSALPPAMAAGMGQHCDSLVTRQVDATHWALWEAAAETNKHIGEFLEGLLGAPPLKASI